MNLYKKAFEAIHSADAIIIGASNGLSISEGLHLFANNEAFHELFGDYEQKYGISCILQGCMMPWPNEEEYWDFWDRLIRHYHDEYCPTDVMESLKQIIGDKPYFILTSNGEGHFEKCGFSPDKIYELEGNWKTIQCVRGCCEHIYPVYPTLERIRSAKVNGIEASGVFPTCPKCGSPMHIRVQTDASFVKDREAERRYTDFLKKYLDRNLVFLELGVGGRNRLIKLPFMQMTFHAEKAIYITMNLSEIVIPKEIQHKSIGLKGDLMYSFTQMIE